MSINWLLATSQRMFWIFYFLSRLTSLVVFGCFQFNRDIFRVKNIGKKLPIFLTRVGIFRIGNFPKNLLCFKIFQQFLNFKPYFGPFLGIVVKKTKHKSCVWSGNTIVNWITVLFVGLLILSNYLKVDWDLTLSMLVFTAQQIHHSSPRVNIGKKSFQPTLSEFRQSDNLWKSLGGLQSTPRAIDWELKGSP